MEVLQILTALNALMNLAVDAKINLEKLEQMRQSSGGDLSEEDIQVLADDAQDAINSI